MGKLNRKGRFIQITGNPTETIMLVTNDEKRLKSGRSKNKLKKIWKIHLESRLIWVLETMRQIFLILQLTGTLEQS